MRFDQVADDLRASTTGSSVQLCWHVITSEYPPQVGGVSDYTYSVACGLAAQGDAVHVWCPGVAGSQPEVRGVVVHRDLGTFTREDLRQVGQKLDQFPNPRHILVQWVPHGYGYRSMNVGFCGWLRNRAARRGDRIDIMLHEPYLGFGRNWRQTSVALVHRLMTILLLRAASRVWVSIPEWEKRWRPYALKRSISFEWLPIPSGIRVADLPSMAQTVRRHYVPEGGTLIGHFGTYGWPITSMLELILQALIKNSVNHTVLLMGIGSERFREELVHKEPRLASVVRATGLLSAEDLSHHIAACDLLMQPYPDGVSSRRTSIMAGLSHGKPVVTTIGPLSESFWRHTDALALAPVGDAGAFLHLLERLVTDSGERARIGRAAQALYRERFDLAHTVAALRQAARSQEDSVCAS